jgi:hypothetical protein
MAVKPGRKFFFVWTSRVFPTSWNLFQSKKSYGQPGGGRHERNRRNWKTGHNLSIPKREEAVRQPLSQRRAHHQAQSDYHPIARQRAFKRIVSQWL